ncbi:MAG: IS66 family transposase, partial [Methylocella sp.]
MTRQIEFLTARVGELEAKLGLPPKTPDNSSTPPSQGQKASVSAAKKPERKAHAGAHRPLHPNPAHKRDMIATACQHCGADVSGVAQIACEAYDRVEIKDIKPDVTRVTLHGGTCPCCGKRFKAAPPSGMEPGSPFGENLRALVIYLRFTQGIAFERLARLLSDILGLEISEGALVNMLEAAREAFAAQINHIRARLLSGTILQSDETGLRVGKRNWWLWVFHHDDSAVFVVEPSRGKSVVEGFLGAFRPDFWVSDRYGGQMGWAKKDNQVCLAHLIRDGQYAIDAGDGIFAPGLHHLLGRACRIGRRRDKLADVTRKTYAARLEARLDELMRRRPTHKAGVKIQRVIKKIRRHMFVFVTNRAIPATNNGSER